MLLIIRSACGLVSFVAPAVFAEQRGWCTGLVVWRILVVVDGAFVSENNGVFFALFVVAVIRRCCGPVAFDNHEDGDGANGGNDAEEEVCGDDVAVLDAPRKGKAGGGGSNGSAKAAEHCGKSIEGAEDAEWCGGIGQEDRGGGEGNDDGKCLDHHDEEDGSETRRGCGK